MQTGFVGYVPAEPNGVPALIVPAVDEQRSVAYGVEGTIVGLRVIQSI
jgi:hypothetical protein